PKGAPLVNASKWFTVVDGFDREIRERFGETIEAAVRGDLADWQTTPRGRLAFVILLDQFSRNAFRGTARAFAQDPIALRVAEAGIAAGDEAVLSPIERYFLYTPLVHAEDRERQRRSVDAFTKLVSESPPELVEQTTKSLKYAKMHADI